MSFEQDRLQAQLNSPADDARRRVIGAVQDARLAAHTGDRAELDLYLALLQDRLPVYVGTLADLFADVGVASVRERLVMAARATIDFYLGILVAKVSVFARPSQLAGLRQVMRARDIGPQRSEETIATYLREEQKLGRVSADVEPLASARLLVGGGLNYAFVRMLKGEGYMPSADEYADDIVRGLRLEP